MVTRNRDLQAYLAVDDTVREGRVGFKTSEDLEAWLGVANQPTLPEPQPGWGDVAPAQVADDGSTAVTERSFWLYYVEWNVPQSQKRQLVRQRDAEPRRRLTRTSRADAAGWPARRGLASRAC